MKIWNGYQRETRTTVVNLRKEKHDVYIGRGSPFGNPFPIGKLTRVQVIELYREHFNELIKNEPFKRKVEALRGKRLGCYCKPAACHGDVIVEYLEGPNK